MSNSISFNNSELLSSRPGITDIAVSQSGGYEILKRFSSVYVVKCAGIAGSDVGVDVGTGVGAAQLIDSDVASRTVIEKRNTLFIFITPPV